MDSLKPCPRHGTAPVYDHTKCDGVRFSCNACDEDTFDDFEDAAAAWNTRSEGLPPPGGGGGGVLNKSRTDMFRILADLCDRARETPTFEMLDISDDVTKALAVVALLPPSPGEREAVDREAIRTIIDDAMNSAIPEPWEVVDHAVDRIIALLSPSPEGPHP